MSGDETGGRPVLRIVRGTPTPDELAAIVAVVAAASGGDVRPAAAPAAAGWAAHHRTLRGPLPTGGWRASSAPR